MGGVPHPRPILSSRSLPSGTVTFAFTDIEGSTKRWDRDRSAMEDAVRRHDRILRTSIEARGGAVFKTVGDAFCAVFARSEDALNAMLDAQRALAVEDFSAVDGLRVRMALHTGTTDERNGDYFGPAVNRVARLLSIGHGGQILVSDVTAGLARADLQPEASLRPLGEHRLKDLARPEKVHQLVAPGLAHEFPPLHSLDAQPNNLPGALNAFIGRAAEVAEITALLAAHRSVTLVGAGGIGKTRTSLRVATDVLANFRDGVWLIELAPLSGGEYLPTTVAQAMGLRLTSSGDPLDQLKNALRHVQALLVFDNCEHLIEPTAMTVASILRDCARISVLATSRQALGIAGEAAYRMPTLQLPSAVDALRLTASAAAGFEAVGLFVERATAADQRFVLTDDAAPAVADICRRLDGIPLAIELAAARVRILSPRQLRDRLDARFAVLTRGSRDVLPRQQTLRALIDWSYDLLAAPEQLLLRRLGIFVNGFTIEGASSIGAAAGLEEFEIFDLLASLVDKSLVLAEPARDSLRYRLLESTRLYAREKLTVAGEQDIAAAHHLAYLNDRLATAAEGRERSGHDADFDGLFAAEIDDIRAALDWALRGSRELDGAMLLATIGNRWTILGQQIEARQRLEAFTQSVTDGDPAVLSGLWDAFGRLAIFSGPPMTPMEAATTAVTFARASGDCTALTRSLHGLARNAYFAQRYDEAEAALSEAERLPGTRTASRLDLLETRAMLASLHGDLDAAAHTYEHLRNEHRRLGNPSPGHKIVLLFAEVEHERGRTREAIALVEEILAEVRAGRNRVSLTVLLGNVAGYYLAVDDVAAAAEAARAVFREAAPAAPDFQTIVANAAEHLALVLALSADYPRAARLAGYADAAPHPLGFVRVYTEFTTQKRLTALLCERLSPGELGAFLAQGRRLSNDDAVALALAEP